jgi:hypothetical protein
MRSPINELLRAIVFVVVSCATIGIPNALAAEDKAFLARFNDPIRLGEVKGNDRLQFNRPTEGYYSCRWFRIEPLLSGGGENLIDSGFLGFDLFDSGTVRLRTQNKTMLSELHHWRHNPESGRVVFLDGPLAQFFKWPTHVDKWWSTRWISQLELNPVVEANDAKSVVTCTNRNQTISTQ